MKTYLVVFYDKAVTINSIFLNTDKSVRECFPWVKEKCPPVHIRYKNNCYYIDDPISPVKGLFIEKNLYKYKGDKNIYSFVHVNSHSLLSREVLLSDCNKDELKEFIELYSSCNVVKQEKNIYYLDDNTEISVFDSEIEVY